MNEQKDYPLNEKLLEETVHLIERWKMEKDRFEKVEEHRSQVSETVYNRVKTDYEARLKNVSDELKVKKAEVDIEMSVMKEAHTRASKQLEEQKHSLEEVDLRNKLGEFKDEEYRSASNEHREKIDKLTEVVASIEEGINRYQNLFENIDLGGESVADEPLNIGSEEPEESEKPAEEIDAKQEAQEVVEEATSETSAPKDQAILESDIGDIQQTSPQTPFEEVKSKLLVVNGSNAGEEFVLSGTISMGRAESSFVTIVDSRVSRQHARIQQHGDEFIIVDLHSSNGTFVNGQRIDEYVLAPGDEIQIGDTVFQFKA